MQNEIRPDPDRLDTWDEIAAYLRTSRITVQRWERLGLPVHRIHDRGRVFAFKSELEAWQRGRKSVPAEPASQTESPPEAVRQPVRGRISMGRWIVGAGVLGCMVAGLLILEGARTGANPQPVSGGAFSGLGGVAEHPQVSPDGRMVVFDWDGGNAASRHIYVAPVDGGSPRRLTETLNVDTFPRWSPDGTRIAFMRFDWQGKAALTLWDMASQNERTLTMTQGEAPYLEWAPDGSALYVSDRTPAGPFAIFRIPVGTGDREQVSFPPRDHLGDLHCAVSPDGLQLALTRFRAAQDADLLVMRLRDGAEQAVTHDRKRMEGVTWIDGSTLLFAARRTGNRSLLWEVKWERAAWGKPAQTGDGKTDALFPSASPGGGRRRIAYERRLQNVHVMRSRSAGGPMTTIDSDGFNALAAVSPGGEKLAFVSDRTMNQELYVAPIGGTNPMQITRLKGATFGVPSWSPDGTRVAFSATQSGYCGVYLTAEDGSGLVRVLAEQHACGAAAWSRDGQWLYFRSMRSGSAQIWKVRVTGGDLQQVTDAGGYEGFESRVDGSFYFIREGGPYAVTAPEEPVYRIAAGGGKPTPLAVKVRMTLWSLDERGILFFQLWENDSDTKLLRYRFATGAREPVLTVRVRSDRLRSLRASADGGEICWGQVERSASEIAILGL